MGPSVVVIGGPDQAVVLRTRLADEPSVFLYTDGDSLKALDAILAHPPKILALDRSFALTARAASLVARLRAEPHVKSTDIRVLGEDAAGVPLLLDTRGPSIETAVLKTSHPLDYCGTRRAPRFVMGENVNVVVNGERGQLINVSATGAQVVAPVRLRPQEPLRLALVDESAEVRLRGVVAWSVVEPARDSLRYRAGVEFINADALAVDEFCVRHVVAPDRRDLR
jgi:PilZ domain